MMLKLFVLKKQNIIIIELNIIKYNDEKSYAVEQISSSQLLRTGHFIFLYFVHLFFYFNTKYICIGLWSTDLISG